MYNINYDYLRPLKANALEKQCNKPFCKKEKLEIWHGENATILPVYKSPDPIILFGCGGVVDSDGNYQDISSIDGRVSGKYPFENAEYRDQKVVYCGYLVNQWGHFLIEAVNRLWYFLNHHDGSVDKYIFTIEKDSTREIGGNYKEFLTLIGIWDKVEIINSPVTYREVIVPEVSYYRTVFYSDEFSQIFKAVADNAADSGNTIYPEKIYLSRGQLEKAQKLEPGTDAVDNFFEKNGYTLLYPEKLSLTQLILHIKNAKICASVSGTLPHNMLFGADGQKLVIAERTVIINEIQCELNIIKSLDVTYIDANLPVYSTDPSYGPFIMGYSKSLKRFAEDNSMSAPDSRYTSKKYLKQCFASYMKAYFEKYHYQWYMADWFIQHTDYIYEGYEEGFEVFKDYLRNTKPFKFSQYLTLNPVARRIKRIVRILTK